MTTHSAPLKRFCCPAVVVCDEPDAALDSAARDEGWPVLGATAGDVLRYVRVCRPGWVVTQVRQGPGLRRTLQLIGTLRERLAETRLAGWSPRYEAQVERAVRIAGVHLAVADQDGLRVLRDLLLDRIHPPSGPPPNRDAHPPSG